MLKIWKNGIDASFKDLLFMDITKIGSFSGMMAYAYQMSDFYLASKTKIKNFP